MKKTITILLTIALAATLITCASAQKGPTSTPEWLNTLPPEDALWGIGAAKQSSLTMSMTTAEARARTSLARQLDTKVQAMFTDYNLDAGNVNNQANSSLQENVSRQITNVNLTGARPINSWESPDGTWWYLVEVKKSDVKNDVASILRNEEAAFAQFKAQQALEMLDKHLSGSERPPVVDN